jgi:hypothetical protein
MIKAFESVGEPANFLDDEVDSLGAAVADAVGIDVGQDLSLPGAEVSRSSAGTYIGTQMPL